MTTPQTRQTAASPASLDDLLSAYAAGTTSPGLSLLCAAHLTLRPDSRAEIERLERIGGALLVEEPCDSVSPLDFDALMARVDQEESAGTRTGSEKTESSRRDAVNAGPLPAPILRAAGGSYDGIAWRKRLGGVSECAIEGFSGEKVGLLRARPGARIPKHTHAGLEATLVLQGVLRDGGQDFGAGDVALAGPEDDHIPEIIGDETCYCLVVVDGALRFTGRFGRALNLFAD